MINNEKYNVQGMTCASCVSHVEKATRKVEGVKDVSVNLLTNSMLVTYSSPASPALIEKAVADAGYKASLVLKDKKTIEVNQDEDLVDNETPKLLKRLIISVIILIPLFYFGMGYMNADWSWPLGVIGSNPFYFGLTEMILSLIIMLVNYKFFVNGFKALFHGGPNMDTLVALGSGVAFIYGLVVMFMMAGVYNDPSLLMKTSMSLTFETAGMVPTLITIGKTLESYSKGKTTNALKSLLKLAPKFAHVIRDEQEITIPANEVVLDDIFIVKPGEAFPVDGIVLEGESSVNEAALTGESMPIDKHVGDKVSAATINQNGVLKCVATRVGNETTLHQIIDMVKTAAGTKTQISRIADKVSGIFVPAIIIIALIVFSGWLIFGNNFTESLGENNFTYSLSKGVSILVIACPCALGLATPVAIMVGSGKGAKNGILFKNASSLEESGKADFVVIDKTGTLTKGEPEVTDIISKNNNELLSIAYGLEKSSEHPLAKAIIKYANENNINGLLLDNIKAIPGKGITGHLNNKTYYGGNVKWMEELSLITKEYQLEANKLADQGKTPLLFASSKEIIGIIGVADVVKEDSKEAIEELKMMGITPLMLTGDNKRTAKAIADELGLSHFVSDVLPDEKLYVIQKLKSLGKVIMIGDGINDAPALTEADIGIAIGAGSDVAIDSADIVLMKSSLKDAVGAIRLSRHTLTNIKENLFWAFIYNLIMIPIASGIFVGTGNEFLIKMKPWYGALAMALSSVTVCLNALRINLFNIYDKKKDLHHKKIELPNNFFGLEPSTECPIINNESQENLDLELKIDGMMCEMCVKHVKNALNSVEGVEVISVNLENKNAIIKKVKSVKDDELKKVISNEGYKVIDIIKLNKKGINMTKEITIEGMKCMHCVKHAKDALEKIEGVTSAEVNLETKLAKVEVTKDIKDEIFIDAIKEAGYQVTSIK